MMTDFLDRPKKIIETREFANATHLFAAVGECALLVLLELVRLSSSALVW